MPDTLLLVGLAASTLLSEDAACIAAGVLIRQGAIGEAEGVAACAAGIYLGDALLWWAGRLLARGARVRAVPATWLDVVKKRGDVMTRHVDSSLALVASRFLPGTRLPMYLAAGAFGRRPQSFFVWTLVGVLLWTPLIVIGTASTLVGGVLAAVAVHLGARAEWRRMWWRMSAALQRWRRWEFWPTAWVYAPVVLHIMRLAWRHGGLATLSAANPGIAEGGFVGESKSQILAQLPPEWTLDAIVIEPAGTPDRVARLHRAIDSGHLDFPLILKPDQGQRGVGVRLVKSLDEAGGYFDRQHGLVIAQRYHPGPFEAGIFYYRRPGDARGRIFGVTDKRFPVVIGDGQRTLEELIWAHPRFRLQAAVFLARQAGERQRVPAAGEQVRLAIAGNHAQGTMFVDGRSLITPALEHRIDQIAQRIPGFYIGRFDVRYADVARFRDGKDVAIVELNGVTSEATHIYDPSYSIFRAVRVLCEQWTLIFEIGAANRAAGHAPTSVRRLLRLSLEHLRHTPTLPIAS